jgi:hypothetical protein
MTIRCPHHGCEREIDTDFNTRFFDKKKGWGYQCPFCYGFIKMIRFREKPVPRVKPHGSKKERRRQREEAKAEAMASAKETA